ncbi:condensation domain-containing protein [Streptomyces sp. N35]|uniref:condensation domain-containing protein n=1 Tax=Streptomyces sp. N35 TaxID=2795730 RepID=UPI0018F49B95|nr:condensation domain-containing protein [Streptomyces sp. N35]
MTTSRFARPQDEPIAVIVRLGPDEAPVVELRGPIEATRVKAALDALSARRPDTPAWLADLHSRGPGQHTLRFNRRAHSAREQPPLAALADLPTGGGRGSLRPRRLPATPLQRELLADADAHPGSGRQVEQVAWDWHGPLDVARFTAAWHSVFARESVLRTAFDGWAEPGLVIHEEAESQILRMPYGSTEWPSLVEAERRRGIDPRRPAPLRITLLGGGPQVRARPARVLLTYHHALLDGFSIRLLVREFYRGYLAGGVLPGGERRPDMTDYGTWLAAQRTTPAEGFFAASGDCAVSGGVRAGEPLCVPPLFTAGGRGDGRSLLRLTEQETTELRRWAARWGAGEFIALQAVWSLLLYRAGRAEGRAQVRFATTATGRTVPFEGAELTPGALAGPLPQSVLVDPHATLPELIAALRDRFLDQTAYEWMSLGQIHDLAGRTQPPADTLLTFEAAPRILTAAQTELGALGVEVEPPQSLGAHTAYPVTLIAQHDRQGRLVLTATYDRAHRRDVMELLAHVVLLLRELPRGAGEFTSVGEALELLSGLGIGTPPRAKSAEAPKPGEAPEDRVPQAVLRLPACAGAGTIGLLRAPGISRAFYGLLAHAYSGPEEILLLGPVPAGGPAADTAARAVHATLGARIRSGAGLALVAFSGDGEAACAIAALSAADGHRPLAVVLDAAGTAPDSLARALASALGRGL